MGLGRELGCCRGWLGGGFERDWEVRWEGWEEKGDGGGGMGKAGGWDGLDVDDE